MTGHYLPADVLAEAGTEDRDARAGLVLVGPGLPPAHEGLAVVGQVKFGLRRTFRNTAPTVSG